MPETWLPLLMDLLGDDACCVSASRSIEKLSSSFSWGTAISWIGGIGLRFIPLPKRRRCSSDPLKALADGVAYLFVLPVLGLVRRFEALTEELRGLLDDWEGCGVCKLRRFEAERPPPPEELMA